MLDNILPLTKLTPGVAFEIDPSLAIAGLRGMPRRLLLIGQVADTASIETGKVIGISTKAAADDRLGMGSMLHSMWQAAADNAIMGLPIDVIALHDDATAAAATGSVQFTGIATHAGTISLYVGGVSIRVGAAKGATASDIATAISADIANLPELPVNATVSGDTVNLTCNWKGETGNSIDIRLNYYYDDELPKGISATINPMTGGSLNPDLTPAIEAIKNYRATEIVSPYVDSVSMTLIEEELNNRWKPHDMQDGQLIVSMRGSEGEHLAWLADRNELNGHSIHTKADMTNPWETAAMAGAAIESRSVIDPVYPYVGARLHGYRPALPAEDLEETEHNNLLTDGGSYLTSNNNEGFLGRMVTNRTETNNGAEDASVRNLNWVKAMSYWRWFCVIEWLVKVHEKGFKIAKYVTEPIPGQRIITEEFVEEFQLRNYDKFMDAGIFQHRDFYKENLLIELDGTHGKVKIQEQPVLITQHYQTETKSQYRAGDVGRI